jgi:hypothetical protein
MTSMEAHLLGRTLIILRSIVHAKRRGKEIEVGDDFIRDARALLEDIEEFEPELREMK